jgi:hypothetical protein
MNPPTLRSTEQHAKRGSSGCRCPDGSRALADFAKFRLA